MLRENYLHICRPQMIPGFLVLELFCTGQGKSFDTVQTFSTGRLAAYH